VGEAGYFNDPAREFHHLFERHLDDLIPALRAGGQPPIHARTGRRALELAVACIRSFEESRQVSLDVAALG
jgi:predicted dehydrogenase